MIEFPDGRTNLSVVGIPNGQGFVSKHWLWPAAKEMLLFLAWLRHWVHPNGTAKDRISVAFNLRFMPRASALPKTMDGT